MGLTGVPEAQQFRAELKLSQPLICDPQAKLYDHFGLKRAKLGQVLNPSVFQRGMQAAKAGHKVGTKPIGDPWRLAGTFVIDRQGRVAWSHRSRHAADNASLESIRAGWLEAKGQA